jgi:hypothetical protein
MSLKEKIIDYKSKIQENNSKIQAKLRDAIPNFQINQLPERYER